MKNLLVIFFLSSFICVTSHASSCKKPTEEQWAECREQQDAKEVLKCSRLYEFRDYASELLSISRTASNFLINNAAVLDELSSRVLRNDVDKAFEIINYYEMFACTGSWFLEGQEMTTQEEIKEVKGVLADYKKKFAITQ